MVAGQFKNYDSKQYDIYPIIL